VKNGKKTLNLLKNRMDIKENLKPLKKNSSEDDPYGIYETHNLLDFGLNE
jgi:hypothetical protein